LRNLRQGGRDLGEAVSNIASTPQLLGDALGWAIDKVPGLNVPPGPVHLFDPPEALTSEAMQQTLASHGMGPQPLTPNEQTIHAGITSGLSSAPFGPVQMVAGLAGGALGQKIISELPADTEDWKKALIGGLTGFATGALAGGGAQMFKTARDFREAQQDVARQEALVQQRIAEHASAKDAQDQWRAHNQGLPHPSEPGITETTADAAKRLHTEAVQRAQDTADQLTTQIASGLGPPQAPADLGKTIQDSITDWSKNEFRQKINDLEAPLAQKVPGDAPVEHGSLLRKLEELQGHHAGELAGPASALFPASVQPIIDRFLAKFAGDEGGDMEELPESATFSWDDAKRFRSQLGDARHDSKTVENLGAGNLEALYNTATEQMRDTALEHEAGDEFNAYNQGTSALYDLKDRFLSRLGDDGKRLREESVGTLVRSVKENGSLMGALRAANPSVADQFAAYFLHSQGTEGWSGLAPEAKEALVPDPNVRLGLDSAAEARDRAIESSKRVRDLARQKYISENRQASGDVSSSSTDLRNAHAQLMASKRAASALPQPVSPNALMPRMGALGEGALGTLAGHALHGQHGALIGGALGLLEHPARAALHGLISRPALTARALGTGVSVGNALLPPDFAPKGP
jgi:hypothetical protein